MTSRAVIAGATGLIGSNLANHLVSKGWEVYGPRPFGTPFAYNVGTLNALFCGVRLRSAPRCGGGVEPVRRTERHSKPGA